MTISSIKDKNNDLNNDNTEHSQLPLLDSADQMKVD